MKRREITSGQPCTCGCRTFDLVLKTRRQDRRQCRILRCRQCGLMAPDPFPKQPELETLYKAYGEYVDRNYQQRQLARRGPIAQRHLCKFVRWLRPEPRPKRLLEVGCSNGSLLYHFQQQSDFECHGVELDPVSAQMANELLPEGRIRTGTLEQARYPDAWFSVIYAEQVIEHVPDTMSFFDECRRVLTPGGVLFVATPNFRGFSARVLRLHWKEYNLEEHIRLFTEPSLRYHLTRAGFIGIQTKTGGISMRWRLGSRDLLPVRRDGQAVRVISKILSWMCLGDNLQAVAKAPAHVGQPF